MTEDTRQGDSEAQRRAQGAITRTVVENVRALRHERRWTGELIAERMTKLGTPWTQVTVSKLENGYRASLTVDELVTLAALFEVTPEELLSGTVIAVTATFDERLRRLEAAVFGGRA